MTENCLDDHAQFGYLNNITGTLDNLENNGSLVDGGSTPVYKNRWAVYRGVAPKAIKIQHETTYYLTQTPEGALKLGKDICAEPEDGTAYVKMVADCDQLKIVKSNQKFTFGKRNRTFAAFIFGTTQH